MTIRIGEEEERGKGRVIKWYEERGRDGSQYPSHPLFACIVQMCIWVSVTLSSSPLSPNFFLSLYLSHPSFLFILLCLPPYLYFYSAPCIWISLFQSFLIYLSIRRLICLSIYLYIYFNPFISPFRFIYPHILSSLNMYMYMYMPSSSFIIITDLNNIWLPTRHLP